MRNAVEWLVAPVMGARLWLVWVVAFMVAVAEPSWWPLLAVVILGTVPLVAVVLRGGDGPEDAPL